MNPHKQFRGIFGIPPTPFNADESVDQKSLESVLHFTVESGCHGVVMPVMASEFNTLTDAERRNIVETTVRVVAGRIPVVAGVTGSSNPHSIELAKHAQGAGADAVIAMPPHGRPPSADEVKGFYELLGKAVGIPIFIQNHSQGARLSAEQLAALCRDVASVQYVKEETTYPGHVGTRLLELAGDSCKGVMGGSSGRYLLLEFARGFCGNMPASHYGDAMSTIWKSLDSGKEKDARALFQRMLPLINFENLYGIAAFKAVFVRRGVIAGDTIRSPGRNFLDRHDHAELDRMLAEVSDLLTWRKKK
jgi:4-hydroxy-tetrahydrodipicolinate synthase